MNQRKRVLILGAGFGGLYAALALDKTLARAPDIEVVIVNRENFLLFTPMLHEIAAGDLHITDIVACVRKMLRHVTFFEQTVEKIDLENRQVVLSHGGHAHTIAYDYLVLGLGAITNFYKLPGLQERALTMKTIGDAFIIRNRLIANLEAAEFDCTVEKCPELLTVVVAGGGFAGVEATAAANDFLRDALRFYPHLNEDHLRVVLVHAGPLILPELGPKLGTYAQKKLAERKVEIHVNTQVVGVTDAGVALSDGTVIKASTLVWTAGISSNPLLATLPCKQDHGRVVVNEYMEVEGWPGVWALGDCARVPDRTTGGFCPPTAQHALRQGKVLAHNVTAAVRGGQKKPFVFSTLGQLAAIGRRTGVASIMGFNFSGFIAWFLWRSIYLIKLPGFEQKVHVALGWALDLFFSKDPVQFLTGPAPTVSHAVEESVPTPPAAAQG